jgi:hypothetical protein
VSRPFVVTKLRAFLTKRTHFYILQRKGGSKYLLLILSALTTNRNLLSHIRRTFPNSYKPKSMLSRNDSSLIPNNLLHVSTAFAKLGYMYLLRQIES